MKTIAIACVLVASCSSGAELVDAQAPGGSTDAAEDAEPQAAPDAEPLADAGSPPDAEPPPDASPADIGMVVETDAGAAPDASTFGPYAQDGSETYSTLQAELTNGARTFEVVVYLPDSATAHPVVLFAPGTQQPTGGYEGYFRRLASHGIMVVARDDPGVLVRTPVVVSDLVYVATEWLPARNADASSPLHGRVDVTRIGLAGHSRGGKATLLAAEGGLHGLVRGYFGVDTVDVTFIDDGVYSLTEVANVGIPTAFLVASIPSNCSPANANGEVLYNAAPSPSVLLIGIDAGHMQFASSCFACGVCSPDGTVDSQVVLDYSIRYLTAFFARELLGDTSVGPALEGAGTALDVQAGLMEVRSK